MGDWTEKEWDEPGPDFGKVYYRPARRLIRHLEIQKGFGGDTAPDDENLKGEPS